MAEWDVAIVLIGVRFPDSGRALSKINQKKTDKKKPKNSIISTSRKFIIAFFSLTKERTKTRTETKTNTNTKTKTKAKTKYPNPDY
ncbi:hypothetical protein M0812_21406 [Anaeramoeba flamelloides]|uniref:Uncharacterized protein n=1 Tax=Anaeramoeba flamelloides TaxID=1746091 RepID=A0AAV7YVM4_9EUKA|nr:hypothetical protein M0812_21406 [Anaeramoeba flamelloides]